MKLRILTLLIFLAFFSHNSMGQSEEDKEKEASYLSELVDNWLRLNSTQEVIIQRLGSPEQIGEAEYWDAIGQYVQKWEYTNLGIVLEMTTPEEDGEKKVLMITLIDPCTLKTSKLIGIGSTRDDVVSKYKDRINNEFTNQKMIVVDSIYGGIVFYHNNTIVYKIFIGALAE